MRRTYPKDFTYGKWLVEREWLQLNDRLPQPPFKEPDVVAESVSHVLEKFGIDFCAVENNIQQHWADIVGADLAGRTHPGEFTGGTLAVYVKGSVWLAELKRYGAKNMLKSLNDFCGENTVKNIVFRASPTGNAPQSGKRTWPGK